jgi:chaperonin cofactor prefoldin
MVEARDRIVQEALLCLGGEADRLREEEDLARRRLAQVHADIGRLVEVLKSLGARGLSSVQSELERLEEEEGQIKQSLADIARRQAPVERVSDDARSFVETWQDIGDLLASATPEERMQILQHYIEVVELGLIDPETRTGSYAMRLFPEVRPDRGSTSAAATTAQLPARQRQTEPSLSTGTAPLLLTLDSLVRTTVQKAPRGCLNSIHVL